MSSHAGAFVVKGRRYEADDPTLTKLTARRVEVFCSCREDGWPIVAGPGVHDVLPVAKGTLAKHQHEEWAKE